MKLTSKHIAVLTLTTWILTSWNPVAQQWSTITNLASPRFQKSTRPMRTQTDGKGNVYVWGFNNAIHNVNGERSGLVVRLKLATGAFDKTFSLGPTVLNVLGGAVDSQGRLYLGAQLPGDATDAGQNNRIVRVMGTGAIDASYNSPVFSAMPRWVSMTTMDKLIVSQPGVELSGSGVVSNTTLLGTGGAAENPFSQNSPTLAWSTSFAPPVVDLQGRVLIAGLASGIPLARLKADGTLDTTFTPNGFTVYNASIRGVGVQSSGKIIIAGRFGTTGSARYGLLRLNEDGSLDSTFKLVTTLDAGFATSAATSGRARSIKVLADNRILALGDYGMRRFNGDGSLDLAYPGVNFDLAHFWMEVMADGGVLIPSESPNGNKVGGTTVFGIIKLLPDGTLDTAFNPPSFGEEVIPAGYVTQSDGKIVAFGGGWSGFDSVNGVLAKGMVRLGKNGEPEAGYQVFNTLPNFQGVQIAALGAGDTLYAVLNIGLDAFTTTNRMVKINSAGVIDNLFKVPADSVRDLFAQQTNILILQSSAQAVLDGSPELVRRLPSGALDSSFAYTNTAASISKVYDLTLAPYPPPYDLARIGRIKVGTLAIYVLPDYKIIGARSTSTNTGVYELFRLNADGSFDSSFTKTLIGGVGSGRVDYPVLQSGGVSAQVEVDLPPPLPIDGVSGTTNGLIYLYGSIRSFQGQVIPGLARLRADGTLDTTFTVGTGPALSMKPQLSPTILAIAPVSGGGLWIAGRFDKFNGVPASGLVLLTASGAVSWQSPKDLVYDFESLYTGKPVIVPVGDSLVFFGGEFRRAGDLWPTAINFVYPAPLPPALLKVSQTGTGLRMIWSSTAGLSYQFSTSTNLNGWNEIGPVFPGTGSSLTNELPFGPDRVRFFRMRQY